MAINECQKNALRTKNSTLDSTNSLGRGLNGEAGECIDILKKHLFQGHELDREHMAKELGDVVWYLAVPADDLETVTQMNADKLSARYPDGFNIEQSLHHNKNDI